MKPRLVQMAFSDPDYVGKSLDTISDSFIEGSVDHLLLNFSNILAKIDVNFVQNRH